MFSVDCVAVSINVINISKFAQSCYSKNCRHGIFANHTLARGGDKFIYRRSPTRACASIKRNKGNF